LIYSHDTFGLGNIRRVLAIAKHLIDVDPEVSILILSGSPMLHAFQLQSRIDYVKLPCLTRTQQGKYAVKFLSMEYSHLIKMRSSIISHAVRDFEPDLIMVDKKPLGVENELLPALRMDAQTRLARRARLVLVLRDILDSPEVTKEQWRKHEYHRAIEDFYDLVMVVGSPDVFDVRREYDFTQASAAKTCFCGYIGRELGARPPQAVREELGIDGKPLLLVTVGGGEDGYRVISCCLDGLTAKARRCEFHTLVLCGPDMPKAQQQRIRVRSAALADVFVKEFTDDLMSYMGAADLVLSMGGYNTLCEILTLKKRAIVVPRVDPVQEQWIRAQRMAKRGLMRAIHPDDLSPEGLMRAVEEELTSNEIPLEHMHKIDLDALGRITACINSLLAPRIRGTRPAAPPVRYWPQRAVL
jgi:predicted glycosyltransferase